MDDAAVLLAWRNDLRTRAMSVQSSTVLWKDHLRWLEQRLSKGGPGIMIAEIDGEPVGTVRLDEPDLISYTVAPAWRGRGVAASMLEAARHQFGPRRARIKRANLLSIRAARAAGHRVELLD
jgi:RimJ/RimL family protein N-acetyltransferase